MLRTGITFSIIAMQDLAASGTGVKQCAAETGPSRVALLELYTSEVCDSCPSADRWVSSLAARGLDPERFVTLGFHADYWNDLGWRHSSRSSTAARFRRRSSLHLPVVRLLRR